VAAGFSAVGLVETLAKNLVDQPDKVVVEATESGGSATLMLRVAEEDKGKIIGKQGKVIKALRTVVSAVASHAGQKVVLDLE